MKTAKLSFVKALAIVLLIFAGCTTRFEAELKLPAIEIIQSWTDQAFKNDPMDFQFEIATKRAVYMLPVLPFRKTWLTGR